MREFGSGIRTRTSSGRYRLGTKTVMNIILGDETAVGNARPSGDTVTSIARRTASSVGKSWSW